MQMQIMIFFTFQIEILILVPELKTLSTHCTMIEDPSFSLATVVKKEVLDETEDKYIYTFCLLLNWLIIL